MKPGVGWRPGPGAVAAWESAPGAPRRTYQLNRDERPWGPDGKGPFDRAAYLRRYSGGDDPGRDGYWPQGMAAELGYVNKVALENWYFAQPRSHQEQWSGVATPEEEQDLAVTTPRRSTFYQRWWWQELPGGSPDNPIVVTEENFSTYGRTLAGAKVTSLGRHTVPTVWPWPLHFDVRWLPGGAIPQPPPGSGPAPPVPPPPAPIPGRATPRRRAEEWHETLGAVLGQARAPRWIRDAWWLGRSNFVDGAEALITLKRARYG